MIRLKAKGLLSLLVFFVLLGEILIFFLGFQLGGVLYKNPFIASICEIFAMLPVIVHEFNFGIVDIVFCILKEKFYVKHMIIGNFLLVILSVFVFLFAIELGAEDEKTVQASIIEQKKIGDIVSEKELEEWRTWEQIDIDVEYVGKVNGSGEATYTIDNIEYEEIESLWEYAVDNIRYELRKKITGKPYKKICITVKVDRMNTVHVKVVDPLILIGENGCFDLTPDFNAEDGFGKVQVADDEDWIEIKGNDGVYVRVKPGDLVKWTFSEEESYVERFVGQEGMLFKRRGEMLSLDEKVIKSLLKNYDETLSLQKYDLLLESYSSDIYNSLDSNKLDAVPEVKAGSEVLFRLFIDGDEKGFYFVHKSTDFENGYFWEYVESEKSIKAARLTINIKIQS